MVYWAGAPFKIREVVFSGTPMSSRLADWLKSARIDNAPLDKDAERIR